MTTDVNNPTQGELYLDETGNPVLVDGHEAIAQHVFMRIRQYRGEWFKDQRTGCPWRSEIFVKNPDSLVVRDIIRQVIVGTPGVDVLEALDISINGATRTLSVDAEIRTDAGAVISTTEFGPFIVEI